MEKQTEDGEIATNLYEPLGYLKDTGRSDVQPMVPIHEVQNTLPLPPTAAWVLGDMQVQPPSEPPAPG